MIEPSNTSIIAFESLPVLPLSNDGRVLVPDSAERLFCEIVAMNIETVKEALDRMKRLVSIHFRMLQWSLLYHTAEESDPRPAGVRLNEADLSVLNFKTVADLREGKWEKIVVSVHLEGKYTPDAKGRFYRGDLKEERERGGLIPLPGNAKVESVELKADPECLPELDVWERMEEVARDLEDNLPAELLIMVNRPWLPPFRQCKGGGALIEYMKSRDLTATHVRDELREAEAEYRNWLSRIRHRVKAGGRPVDESPVLPEAKGNAPHTLTEPAVGRELAAYEAPTDAHPEDKALHGFAFVGGQVFYRDCEVHVPGGHHQEVLRLLVEHCNRTVAYTKINEITAKDRRIVSNLRKILREAGLPFSIETVTNSGYALRDAQSRHTQGTKMAQ